VRHSFDVYEDQLLALAEVQTALFRKTGRKPKMGELVRTALDAYIQAVNERSDERTAARQARTERVGKPLDTPGAAAAKID